MITHPCPKPPLKLGHGWVITYYNFSVDAIIYPCPKLSGGLTNIVRKRAEFEFERSRTVSCILE